MAKLGDIIEQIRGVSYKPADLHDNLNNNSVILLRANNIQNGKIVLDDVVYVSKNKVSESQYLRQGDILVCTSSGSKELVGKAAFVDKDLPMVFGAFCKVVRPKIECCEYMGHFFQSPYYRNHISAASAGANINNLRNEHIADLHIPLPSFDEQCKIAAVLDKVSDLIAKRRQQLDKLDEMVKARFVEMFNGKHSESTLLSLCNIIDYRGKTPEKVDSGLPFITAKNIKMHHMTLEPREYISKETYDKVMVRGFPKEGDVVFTTEAPLGNVCRIPHFDTEFYIGQRIVTLQTVSLHPAYLEYALDTESFKKKVAEKSSGSTVTGIRVRLLEQLTIPVPPIELQNQFAAFVEQIEKTKTTISISLKKLETLKKALMQKYFG